MVQFFFVVLFSLAETILAAEEVLSAKQILEKMVKAMEMSDYQGTVVFLKNDKLETMKYFHSLSQNRRQERLVSLNSPLREIIRNSDEVKCSYKLTRQVIVDHRPYEHSFIVDAPYNLDELTGIYRFEVVGDEEVAMLPAYVVTIQPKDDLRYVRKIWISKQHFLPLKAVVYDLSGIVLEQVVFTEMKVNKQVSGHNGNNNNTVAEKSPDKNTSLNEAAFEVTVLPQGFKQIFFARKPLQKTGQPVDHMLLSDGFASVSVYLEQSENNSGVNSGLPEGIHSTGAINSMSRKLESSQLTVLGEVPATTVKFIAEGVKLRQSAD